MFGLTSFSKVGINGTIVTERNAIPPERIENPAKNHNTLEKILNNPGLQHLAEKIFDNLNFEYLAICRGINESSKQILDYQTTKPMFVLRKFSGISQQNKKDWIEVVQSANNSEKEKAIASYLEWSLKKDVLVDLPCYSSPDVQDDFR